MPINSRRRKACWLISLAVLAGLFACTGKPQVDEVVVVIDAGHGTGENPGTIDVVRLRHLALNRLGQLEYRPDGTQKVIESPVEALPAYIRPDNYAQLYRGYVRGRQSEDDLSLALARAIRTECASRPWIRPILSRDSTAAPGLEGRVAFANEHHAHYFISIHLNAEPLRDGAKDAIDILHRGAYAIVRGGVGDWREIDRQKQFAAALLQHYTVVPLDPNSIRVRDDLYVLSPNRNRTPYRALLELGFLTNYEDRTAIRNNFAGVARQICDGLEAHGHQHWQFPERGK